MIELEPGLRRGVLIVDMVAVLIVLAGCATSPQPLAQRGAPVVPAPRPAGVQDPAIVQPAVPAPPCDPLVSLRPPKVMPTPGQMPQDSTMARIVERGVLRAGVDQNMNLFGFRDPKTSELTGFDIDFVREIARALFDDPGRVVFRTVTSANREQVLRDGEIDLIANSMTITCERKQRSLFTTNYFDSGQRVMVRQGSPYGESRTLAESGSVRLPAPRRSAPLPRLGLGRFRLRWSTGPTDWCCCSRGTSRQSPPRTAF